jgi:glycine C-acetyltransferase
MDGNIAPLDKIKKLAEQYNAMIMVDESHSAGVIGKTGRGTTEHFNLIGQAEIITGTLGKAFGGAIGGFTTGKKEIIAMLRQRSRPYLFSNSIPPTVAAAGIEAFRIMNESTELLDKLHENRQYFVEQMTRIGYSIKPTQSGICAVMLGDAKLSQEVASRLLTEGIYVIGFYFPVVPQGQARIRVQLSAAHTHDQLVKAVDAFEKVGRDLKILP